PALSAHLDAAFKPTNEKPGGPPRQVKRTSEPPKAQERPRSEDRTYPNLPGSQSTRTTIGPQSSAADHRCDGGSLSRGECRCWPVHPELSDAQYEATPLLRQARRGLMGER